MPPAGQGGRTAAQPLGRLPWHCWTGFPDTSSPPEAGGSCGGRPFLLVRPGHGPPGPARPGRPPGGPAAGCARRHPAGQAPLPRVPGVQPVHCRDGVSHHRAAGRRTDGAGGGQVIMEERLPSRFGESAGVPLSREIRQRRNQPLRVPPALRQAGPVPRSAPSRPSSQTRSGFRCTGTRLTTATRSP